MARLFSVIKNLLFMSRNASSASDGLRIQTAKAGRSALKKEGSEANENIAINYTRKDKRKDVYWMRDPKTGNWIPETHIGEVEVDAVELRRKFLSKKHE
ncbi:Protein SENESCENCE-ASSOCIATED GENE 21 mitochondrial [Bienertia sinuspersici]